MIQQQQTRRLGIEAVLLFAAAVVLLVASRRSWTVGILAVLTLSATVLLSRPVVFIYLLAACTLFVPELSVGSGLNPNLFLLAGLGVAVVGRIAVSETWMLPESRYVSAVLLFGIVGVLSLLKAFLYFEVLTVAVGGFFLAQWLLYLLVPVLMVVYLRGNVQQVTDLLAFVLIASAVMALYLLGLFLLDIRPIETTVSIAGHRPLVAFWQQGNLAVGMFTALTTLVSLGLAIKESNRWVAGALVALTGLCAFLTLATLARSAILGLVVGLFIIAWLEYRWETILAIMVAVPLGIVLAPEWLILRFTRSTFFWSEVPALGIAIPIGTLAQRVDGWVRLGGVFLHNPLVGIGFSLSQERASQLFGPRVSPDNQYIGLLVETGFLGFVVFWLWARLVFRRLYRTYRDEVPELSGLALGMLGGFAGFLVWGFFQGFYARWRVLGPLFIYVGLIYAGHESSAGDD